MKALITFAVTAMCFVVATCTGHGASSKYTEKYYPAVKRDVVKATPETYKFKKVSLVTVYAGYKLGFPHYVAKSFKEDKSYYLYIDPLNLAVMGDKKGLLNEIIPSMKKGTPIKLYGKIRKFSSSPADPRQPEYYLDLDYVEVLDANSPEAAGLDKVWKKLRETTQDTKENAEKVVIIPGRKKHIIRKHRN